MKPRPLHIALFISGLITFIMLAISVGGASWIKMEDRHIGLWKICYEKTGQCYSLHGKWAETWLKVTRTFSLMSTIVTGFSVLFVVLAVATKRVNILLPIICLFFAAIFEMIAMVVYSTEKKLTFPGNIKYSWGYHFGWMGFAAAFVSGFIGVVLRRGDEEYTPI